MKIINRHPGRNNPGRSGTDDATDAIGSTDIRPSDDNSGNAWNPHHNNKAYIVDIPGQCRRGIHRLPWIR